MTVRPVTKSDCQKIVEGKHYSGRLGIFWEGFGLYDSDHIIGVACFGQPSAPIQKHAFKDRDFRLYELTRLVVDSGTANGASFLIASSLRMLTEKRAAVISYADTAQGHAGIVYQATNWIYTGGTVAHDSAYLVNGEKLHPMTIRDRFGVNDPARWAKENGIVKIPPCEKHRYFYFLGSKSDKRAMRAKLRYPVVNQYPKLEKSTYSDGDPCRSLIAPKVEYKQTSMFDE